MVDTVEVLRANGGDRLALVGLGLDFSGGSGLDAALTVILNGNRLKSGDLNCQPVNGLRHSLRSALAPVKGKVHETGLLWIGPKPDLTVLDPSIGSQVVDFSGYAEPLPAMLTQAQEWLENHIVDAVLLVGCSQAAGRSQALPTLGFDQTIHEKATGSGSAAVCVMRLQVALQKKVPVYATIESLAHLGPASQPLTGEKVHITGQAALKAAGVKADEIGYVEALACGDDGLDLAEIDGLVRIYNGSRPVAALGSAQSLTGFLEGVNGLAGLVHAALCVAHRIRPGAAGWSGPKAPELWRGTGLYVLRESLTWFHPNDARKAALSLPASDGSCAHLILSGNEPHTIVEPAARPSGLYLLPISASSLPGLIERLQGLKTELQSGKSPCELAHSAYSQFVSANLAQRAAILGSQAEDLVREIEFAIRGLPAAAEKGVEWQTPAGSYYTPRALGQEGQIAFVYPGAFNSYIGAGKDLFSLFPRTYEHFSVVARDVGAALREDLLYPRSLAPLAKDRFDRMEADLLADPFAMIMSGTSLSVALTSILRDTFQVQPDCGFGYSLGENSLLFAMEVWSDGLHASQKLADDDLFHTRLAGPKNAVREYWGMPAVSKDEKDAQLWVNYLLMAPPDQVSAVLANEPHVYLTHINTPRQVVIGGDPAGCQRVIERLKCSSLKAPFDYVLHCRAMESEYPALYKIHSLPVHKTPPVRLYSAADDRPFVLSEAEIARAVAKDLSSMLDFPRLVETAYADGARIFIELGAGSNCAKWIEEILRGRPFLSVSANRKGVDDATSILRVLARLVCHQAKLNLDPLYPV